MNMESHPARPKASQRDLFWHFLGMFTLYISAISLTTVFYQIINLTIPDPLVIQENMGYLFDQARDLLRTAVSFLIVMFPVCVLSFRTVTRAYAADPLKAQLRIRKSIIYFTLFVVSFIIMFTVVFLINSFLKGELTLRFFLKLLSIFFVAGSIFWYYRCDLRRYREAMPAVVTE